MNTNFATNLIISQVCTLWLATERMFVHSSDIFDEAQQYVYAKMEELIWDRFLRSEDGQNYLEILVARDIQRKQRR